MAKSAPIWKTKYGSIEICAWEKETEKYGKSISFSISKSWKKGEKWETSVFYFNSATELINVIQAAQSALDFKFRKDETTKNEPANEPDDGGV